MSKIDQSKLCYPAIILSLLCAALMLIPLIFYEKESTEFLNAFFTWFKTAFGSFYLLLAIASFSLCMWLAFSKYGNIKFGDQDEKPQFSTLSWGAMLFCTGIAGGVLYWSIAEPIYYTNWPPMYAEPLSTEAYLWAGTYTFFHWGPIPWSFYIICSIPIGYSFYVRKNVFLRISSCCTEHVSEKFRRPAGITLDVLFVIGLLFSNISIAGFTIPMVSYAFSTLTGITYDFTLELTMLGITAAVYCISSYLGLVKGIARLSMFNVIVGVSLVLFVLVIGPTAFLFDNFINGVGNMLQNFIRLATWTDPHTDGTFPQDWTMFYWAYWLTNAPLTGLFLARISRGRTIRQILLQGITCGVLGGWFIHAVFGGYTLYVQVTGLADLSAIVNQESIVAAIVATLATLPLKEIVLASFCVFSLVFFATTFDSSAFAIALACTDNLDESANPSRLHCLAWALVLAIVPAGLLKIGGLDSMKAMVNASAIPVTIIVLLMMWGFYTSVKQDHKSGKLDKYFTK